MADQCLYRAYVRDCWNGTRCNPHTYDTELVNVKCRSAHITENSKSKQNNAAVVIAT